MTIDHSDIRIGTIVHSETAAETIGKIVPHGFESFQITFGHQIGDVNLQRLADDIGDVLGRAGSSAVVSSLGVYGNPLIDEQVAEDWSRLIDAASRFGLDIVSGFAGRIPDAPIPDCIARFREVFTPLAHRAEDCGVRLAFENCSMGGDWHRGDRNIAHNPAAWELMFDAVPGEALGLEWEPCHQMLTLIDPLPQLREWVAKIFHIHGKDATICWDAIRRRGIESGESFGFHRTPGFGDTNWTDVISILRQGGYQGAIDVEGWHDPVYRDELEMTGQVHALNYLKQCRGGPFLPNP